VKVYAPAVTVALPLEAAMPQVPSGCTGAKLTVTLGTLLVAMPVAVGWGSVDGSGDTSTVMVGTVASSTSTSCWVLTLPSESVAVSSTQ
jgi:hypothetical protein